VKANPAGVMQVQQPMSDYGVTQPDLVAVRARASYCFGVLWVTLDSPLKRSQTMQSCEAAPTLCIPCLGVWRSWKKMTVKLRDRSLGVNLFFRTSCGLFLFVALVGSSPSKNASSATAGRRDSIVYNNLASFA